MADDTRQHPGDPAATLPDYGDDATLPAGSTPQTDVTPSTPTHPRTPGGRSASRASLTIGARLGNRYLVTRLLGEGGMGAVYLADDEVLGKAVALKFVRHDLAGGSRGIEMLRDEVLLAQKVTHYNVCRTYDLEEVDGFYLVKMEYVPGETLHDRILREERLSVEDALEIARSVAAGLAAAHAQGVVHRDLKPHNVQLEERTRRVVLMDFGIARVAAQGASAESAPVGTPQYMAPEQARAQEVDGRADLYALGCVLYHMLVGEVPFPASTPMASALRHIMDPAPDPRAEKPDLPVWVARVIRRLLEKDPVHRYATAEETLRALEGPRRRNWKRIALGGALLAAALVTGGVTLYRYATVSVRYCAAVGTRHGVMECVGPLGEEVRRHRAESWRFSRQWGRVLRVDRIMGLDRPAADDDGRATWEYLYDERGALKETAIRNPYGQVKLRLVYSADLARADRRDALNNPLPEDGTDVAVYLQEFDKRGLLTRQRFANVYGSPRPDGRKAYGYAITSDARGQIAALEALGSDGHPAPTIDGIAQVIVKRDAVGNVLVEEALGQDGKPTLVADGYASLRRRFDEHGNQIEESYYGSDGKPVFCRLGYASVRESYDADGENVQSSYFDVEGKPVLAQSGYAIVRVKYDERGGWIEKSYFGVYGQPILNREGYAVKRRSYGPSTVEETYFDTQGAPTPAADGYARVRELADPLHHPLSQDYFDKEGRPTLTRDGYASRRFRYDERGKLVEESFLGVDGKPTIHRLGYARVHRAWDERRRLVEESFLDIDGQPVRQRDGYSTARMKYDDQGNRVEIAFLDGRGAPIVARVGYAVVRTSYDGRGDVLEQTLFGASGQRVMGAGGFSRRKLAYDARGHVEEEDLYDAADRPHAGSSGWAGRRSRYEARGLLVEESYFAADGARTPAADGCATRRLLYDQHGRRLEDACYDAAGHPALDRHGVAVLHIDYNGRGDPIRESCFGVAGERVLGKDGYWARQRELDVLGASVGVTYLGIDERPKTNVQGVAIVRTRRDDRGRAVEESYLGPSGKPVLSKDGYASALARYDLWGNAVGGKYLGEDGKPIVNKGGSAGYLSTYDSDGAEVRRVEVDVAGEPVSGLGRFAGRELAWNLEGDRLVIYGKDGRPPGDAILDGKLRDVVAAHRAGFAMERLRATRSELFRGARGVLVVGGGESARKLGVLPGDLLLDYDGRRLARPDDLVAAFVNCRQPTKLFLLRDGKAMTLDLPAGKLDLVLEPQ